MKTALSFITALIRTVIFSQYKTSVYTITSDNKGKNITFLNHLNLNRNPYTSLLVEQNRTPLGTPQTFKFINI